MTARVQAPTSVCMCVCVYVCMCLWGCSAPGRSSFTHMVNNPEGADSVTSHLCAHTDRLAVRHTQAQRQPLMHAHMETQSCHSWTFPGTVEYFVFYYFNNRSFKFFCASFSPQFLYLNDSNCLYVHMCAAVECLRTSCFCFGNVDRLEQSQASLSEQRRSCTAIVC